MAAKYSQLVGKAGSQKGKRLQLKKDTMTLGLARSSAIRLKGDYVSDEHAIIRKRVDEKWIVENKSEFGLLVNAERVEARVLSHGDTIQIGAANLLEFEDIAQLNAGLEKKSNKESGWSTALLNSPKQWAIFMGLVVYLGAIAYFLVGRMGEESSGPVLLNSDVYRSAIQATVDYAQSGNVDISEVERGLTENSPSYQFYQIAILSSAQGVQNSQLGTLTKAFESELKALLLSAYQYQQAGQYARAIEVLNRVYLMVPDPRAPIARYSLRMMSEIKSEANRV